MKWRKPSAARQARGILALRQLALYCYTDSGIKAVDYYAGYETEIVGEDGKKKKVFIARKPAVIEYDAKMLLKLWRNNPANMPPFIDVILPPEISINP